MNEYDLYKLMQRIVSGKYQVTFRGNIIHCRDLTDIEAAELAELYQVRYREAIEKGMLSDEDVIRQAIEEGKWDASYDIEALHKQIDMLRMQIRFNRYKLMLVDKLRQQINEIQQEVDKLEKLYHSLFGYNSARFVANITVIHKHIKYSVLDNVSILSSDDAVELYTQINQMAISISDIRKLARNGMWMQKYSAAKNHLIPPIFPDILNITYYQSMLLMWSATYEYARNHLEPPSEQIIEDDDEFDKWLENDAKKNRTSSDANKGEEVFIVSDEAGAKKVYDMNTEDSRKVVKKTLELVKQKGKVSEFERVNVLKNQLK